MLTRFLLELLFRVYCTFRVESTTISPMKPMRLHLYQSFRYLCIPDTAAFYEPEKALKRLKNQFDDLQDEELVVITDRSQVLDSQQNAAVVGSGPFDGGNGDPRLQQASLIEIPEGDYLFYQFADPSPEGIRRAVLFLLADAKAKHIEPASDQIILRGVKETGFYVLQLLLPLVMRV